MRTIINHLLTSTALMAAADQRGPGGEGKPKPGQPEERTVEVGSGKTDFGGSIFMRSGDEPIVQPNQGGGHVDTGEEQTDVQPGAKPEDGVDDGKEVDAEKDEVVEGALPAFDPQKPEVVQQYDATFRPDGKLNMDALSKEWWSHAQAGEQGKLADGTYAYLDSLGIPRSLVQAAEAGQVALNNETTGKLYARAGGKNNLDAAIGWAISEQNPGYNPEQRKAFNEALDKGGVAANEAVDLLMSRFEKNSKSGLNPGRTAGGGSGGQGQGGGTGDVFHSRAEWVAARKEAGSNNEAQAAVSRKFRRSPGAKQW